VFVIATLVANEMAYAATGAGGFGSSSSAITSVLGAAAGSAAATGYTIYGYQEFPRGLVYSCQYHVIFCPKYRSKVFCIDFPNQESHFW
jgi:hypothetical protein